MVSELLMLHEEVHQEAMDWFTNLPPEPQSRIRQHFGSPPPMDQNLLSLTNGPSWAWWYTAILPLSPRAQLAMLAMTSLKERLLALRRVLNYVKLKASHMSQWLVVAWLQPIVERPALFILFVIVMASFLFHWMFFLGVTWPLPNIPSPYCRTLTLGMLLVGRINHMSSFIRSEYP